VSFSSKIKTNISKITHDSRCCQRAELSALVRTSGSISLRGFSGTDLTIRTENAAVARLVFTLFKKVYSLHTELIIKKGSGVKKGNIYEIFIENAQDILTDLGIVLINEGMFVINNQVPKELLNDDCCPRAYIRGAFLGSGSVSDPERNYHLEFNLHSYNYAMDFEKLINQYDLKAKVIRRKSNYIVYLKESEKIVDLLNVIGAHHSLLEFENVRIIKGMRNNVNRLVNCETANLNKTVSAAVKQGEIIRLLDEHIGIDRLPEGLREIALIRMENEDLSLKEIGELMNPPLGKSGVNHRFKKMEKLLLELINEGGRHA
jgi:hypothetical protein